MYENYYGKKKEIIASGLSKWKRKGYTVAIWSAGHKGTDFLRMFDPQCKIISAVFDKDVTKYGNHMPTGHLVIDYREIKTDIVIMVDSTFQMESCASLKQTGKHAKICRIDDVIFGNLTLDEALRMPMNPPLFPVRHVKITALVILYNPDAFVEQNIRSYADDVDRLVLYDNSPTNNIDMFKDIINQYGAEYIFPDGENHGIGKPINDVADIAVECGCDWLVTFDQDSLADTGMIYQMRKYIESDLYNENIAVVAPTIRDDTIAEQYNSEYLYRKDAPLVSYKQYVIQSGAFHNLELLRKVKYNEEMFIDLVDFEYCTRCRLNGYLTVQFNSSLLVHEMRQTYERIVYDGINSMSFNRYGILRYYYRYRNALFCAKQYRETDPMFAQQCTVNLNFLKTHASYDADSAEKMLAIEQAKKDFAENRFGRCDTL